MIDAANGDAIGYVLVHGAPGEGSIASTVRASYERWGAGGASTVYCVRWRSDPPSMSPASGEAGSVDDLADRRAASPVRTQRTGLNGKALTKPAVSRQAASCYYSGVDVKSAGPGRSGSSDGQIVQKSKEGCAGGLRRNATGGFFTVGDSASGMHNGRLVRRVQDWALGESWRENLGPNSARVIFDPTLRSRPGAGTTVRQLREVFTAESNLEVPPGAKWFAEGIVRAGVMAMPRQDHTSRHAQLKYEEWDDETEQIVTRFCCTIPT
jgi:hypothetical protein